MVKNGKGTGGSSLLKPLVFAPSSDGSGVSLCNEGTDSFSVLVCSSLRSCCLQRTTTIAAKSHFGIQDQELTSFSHTEESFRQAVETSYVSRLRCNAATWRAVTSTHNPDVAPSVTPNPESGFTYTHFPLSLLIVLVTWSHYGQRIVQGN